MKMLIKNKWVYGLLLVVSMLVIDVSPAFAHDIMETGSDTEVVLEDNYSDKDISKTSSIYYFGVRRLSDYSGPRWYVYWRDSDNSHDGYAVYRSVGDNQNYELFSTEYEKGFGYDEMAKETFCLEIRPKIGEKYYFKVVPYTNGVPGETSEEDWFTEYFELGDEIEVGIGAGRKPLLLFNNTGKYTRQRAIYRATSKNGKYKKVGFTADDIYLDRGAKAGEKYYYKVKGYYFDGQKQNISSFSNSACFNKKVGYINKIRISRVSKTSLKLSWNKAMGAHKYRIVYYDASKKNKYKTIETKNTSIVLKTLKTNVKYKFRIMALRKTKKKQSSSSVSLVDYDMSARSGVFPIIEKQSNKLTDRGFTVTTKMTWNRQYGIDGYYVKYFSSDSLINGRKEKLPANATSYTAKVTFDNSYHWHDNTYVKITPYKKNKSYETNNSVEILNTCKSVTDVKVKKIENQKVEISWKPSNEADIYRVRRYTQDGDFKIIGKVEANKIVDESPLIGTKCWYMVEAINDRYGSNDRNFECTEYDIYTNEKRKYNMYYVSYYPKEANYLEWFTRMKKKSNTCKFTFSLDTPSIFKTENSDVGMVQIIWNKTEFATSYDVYRATSAKGTYKKIANSTTTSYIDSKLTKGKKYFYKIVAKGTNTLGNTISSKQSEYSSVKVCK